MAHYVAFIDGKPGAYGVSFHDLPGCTAMGKTVDEAVANAADALREWMADRVADGLAPPDASSVENLLVNKQDWSAHVTFAHIPLLLDAGRTVRANISIDAGLLEQIDEAAKLRGLTRSAFLASAAREKITEQR